MAFRVTPDPDKFARAELREAVGQLSMWLRRSFLFTAVAALLMLAPSIYMLEVYDRVINSRNLTTLLMLTLLVVFAYLVMQVLEWAHDQEMQAAGRHLDRVLGQRVLTASFRASLQAGAGAGAGTQPLADLRCLREFLGSPQLKALLEAPVSLLFLLVVFALHPLLGAAALAGGAVQAGIAWLNTRVTLERLGQAQRSAQAAQVYADGVLRHAQVIAAMGLLGDIRSRWAARQREFLGLQARASSDGAAYIAAAKALQVAWASLLLGLAAWLLLKDQLAGGAGMMIVASILGGQALRPLAVMAGHWRGTVQARDAWHRLATLLAAVQPATARMALPRPRGHLQAEHLNVTPPGARQPVLRGVSFELRPGEVLAVVGPSASGKSCLARALVGLWESSEGKVRLDGADVYAWDKSELGPHIGYLPQEVELLEGTLADNIARFGPIDAAQLEAAVRRVGLSEIIEALPGGYGGEIGTDGARLSGGQRQRLGLARALYGNPVLVVLDEPNASLDEAGDAALVRAIAQAKAQGTTFVVITHRASVMPVVDKILWLEEGSTRAYGARDEVLGALKRSPSTASTTASGTAGTTASTTAGTTASAEAVK